MTKVDPDNEATFHVCTIPSDLCAVDQLKKKVFADLVRHHFSEKAQFGIKLALEEALTNAVKHGNQHDPDKKITVRYAVNEEKIAIIIRDEGSGFVPDEVPDPTSPERLSAPCGRGIMLIRAYMDVVEFRDDGRELYFVKHRT